MIRNAVTCDRDGCIAVHLEPDDYPEHAFDDHVWVLGWKASDTAHACPACAAGRGPVMELGECPTCTGRTVDLPDGSTCHYCRTVVPHPADDWS
jgi:hypothetical protein